MSEGTVNKLDICAVCHHEIKGGVYVAAAGGTILRGPYAHYHCAFPTDVEVINDIARRRAAVGLPAEV